MQFSCKKSHRFEMQQTPSRRRSCLEQEAWKSGFLSCRKLITSSSCRATFFRWRGQTQEEVASWLAWNYSFRASACFRCIWSSIVRCFAQFFFDFSSAFKEFLISQHFGKVFFLFEFGMHRSGFGSGFKLHHDNLMPSTTNFLFFFLACGTPESRRWKESNFELTERAPQFFFLLFLWHEELQTND